MENCDNSEWTTPSEPKAADPNVDPVAALEVDALKRFPNTRFDDATRLAEAQERDTRAKFQHEMDNIKEHGPLNRSEESVIPEHLSPEQHGMMVDFRQMVKQENFLAIAERVAADDTVPASHRIFYNDFFGDVDASDDPAYRQEAGKLFLDFLNLRARHRR